MSATGAADVDNSGRCARRCRRGLPRPEGIDLPPMRCRSPQRSGDPECVAGQQDAGNAWPPGLRRREARSCSPSRAMPSSRWDRVTDAGEITLNYVAPACAISRRQPALLRALEARAAERGNTRCTLTSTETAHRFYQSAGYVDDGRAARQVRHELRLSDVEADGRPLVVVGWAKRSVPTILPTSWRDGGHAALCPPYGSSAAIAVSPPCTQCSSICSAMARSSSEALAKARL